MSTRHIVVSILQYIQISNCYIIHKKLICCMSIMLKNMQPAPHQALTHQEAMFLCPDYLKVRYQVTRGSIPMPWSLLKLFKQLNLKLTNPTYSASPIPSHENQDKGFCPCFPLSCFSCEQQLLPSWQSVLCLCVLPYLMKTNPRCILT